MQSTTKPDFTTDREAGFSVPAVRIKHPRDFRELLTDTGYRVLMYRVLEVAVHEKGPSRSIRRGPRSISVLEHVMAPAVPSMWMSAVLEGLELLEDRVAVKGADVARLRLREPADGP